MDKKELLKLVESLEKTGWNKLEISEKGFTIRLEREGAARSAAQAADEIITELPDSSEAPAPEAVSADAPQGGKDLLSPLVGVFHKLSGDKEVTAGAELKKGDVVCMIEAMKLMNEVVMPEDGEILFMAADDGDMVEYGQVLAKYK